MCVFAYFHVFLYFCRQLLGRQSMVTPKLHRMVAGALQWERASELGERLIFVCFCVFAYFCVFVCCALLCICVFAYYCVFVYYCVHVVLWRERLRWVGWETNKQMVVCYQTTGQCMLVAMLSLHICLCISVYLDSFLPVNADVYLK